MPRILHHRAVAGNQRGELVASRRGRVGYGMVEDEGARSCAHVHTVSTGDKPGTRCRLTVCCTDVEGAGTARLHRQFHGVLCFQGTTIAQGEDAGTCHAQINDRGTQQGASTVDIKGTVTGRRVTQCDGSQPARNPTASIDVKGSRTGITYCQCVLRGVTDIPLRT